MGGAGAGEEGPGGQGGGGDSAMGLIKDKNEIPAAPMTQVYQKVEMSSKCENGVCQVKECFDGKCKKYEKKQPPKYSFQKADESWAKLVAAPPVGTDQAKKPEATPAAESTAGTDAAAALAQRVNSLPENNVKTTEVPDNSSVMLD